MACWQTVVILALGSLRQDCQKFKLSLGYIVVLRQLRLQIRPCNKSIRFKKKPNLNYKHLCLHTFQIYTAPAGNLPSSAATNIVYLFFLVHCQLTSTPEYICMVQNWTISDPSYKYFIHMILRKLLLLEFLPHKS